MTIPNIFAAGGIARAADVNANFTTVLNLTVPVVATTAARNVSYPAPATDQRVFNKGTGNVERYTGTAWVTDITGSGGLPNVCSPISPCMRMIWY